jgi:hypothetical protein
MVYFGAQSLDRNTKLNDKSQNTKQATPQIGEAFARAHQKMDFNSSQVGKCCYLVAKVLDMSFRPKGEIFSSVLKDFSVTSFLRNDTVIIAGKC